MRNELKDPDSAQFRDVRANYTEEFGVVACGRVNAKNQLGGYTGFRRFVSGGQSVILEGRDNIAEAWTEACL
ncbi:MAG: class II D-tagatose-bisphosphate aldolase, non-catalytic subunit [Xanthomonadaceae bacterium]|nr:class II D-tagatose-bisphosphate aldolase, non-catalytic subunit [Xanthomonadaceae bacterium]